MNLDLFHRRRLRGPQRTNIQRLFALNGFSLNLKFGRDSKIPLFLYWRELSSR
jgi:hypothetical protein